MRIKRRILLTVCCMLVAALGLQPALGQEQPQKPTEERQAAEDIHLTREVISIERQALVTRGMDLTPSEMQHFWPPVPGVPGGDEEGRGPDRGPHHHLC